MEKEMDSNRLTYWESRSINIGHYEKIECGLSYTETVEKINNVDKKVTISHHEKISTPPTSKEFAKSSKRVIGRVKQVLDAREKQIRLGLEKMEVMKHPELDHLRKLESQGIEVPDEYYVIRKKQNELIAKQHSSKSLTDDEPADDDDFDDDWSSK
jgi:sugar-specific transcriptional regulator TrmB